MLAIPLLHWVVLLFSLLVMEGPTCLASQLTFRTDGETNGRGILVQGTRNIPSYRVKLANQPKVCCKDSILHDQPVP